MSPREIPRGEPRESPRERAAHARATFEEIAQLMDYFMKKDVLNDDEQARLNMLYDAALRIDPKVYERKKLTERPEEMEKAA